MTAHDTDDWQWLSASKLASLHVPGLPTHRTALIRYAQREGWLAPERAWSPSNPNGTWRERSGNGGGYEFHYRVMPARRQVAWRAKHQPKPADPTADRKARRQALARDEAWDFYARSPEKRKAATQGKLAILTQIEEAVRGGIGKDDAAAMAGREHGVGRSTIFGWYERVAGVAREDWLPYLIDHRAGRRRSDDTMPEEAWAAYKELYLTPEQCSHAECYNRLRDAAKERGWALPSRKTFQRRIEKDIPHRVLVLTREGEEAHDRLFPALRRDKTVFHALEAVNYDGHKLDLSVEWPDGQDKDGKDKVRKTRAFLLGFQDIHSGMLLSWRLDTAETAYGFRLAFGDVIETYGIPDHVWSDNTMAAAAKENTAGSRYRRRFKIREDDPVGLFVQIGSEIHFTKVKHGQSKPIERAFGTLSRYISKSPECAGAYTGNSPENKPANYGSTAIPLDELVKVVEREVHRFNHDPALNTNGKGRSRAEVFAESYQASPIRTAKGLSMELRRLWLLAAEGVACRQPDGSVWLHKNRYWDERLIGMIGRKVVLRFDPDRLHQPVHVYRLDGSFVCTAACLDDAGFADAAAAEAQEKARKGFRRATKQLAAAEKTLGMDAVVAMMPPPEAVAPPEAKVVRLVAGNTALAAVPDAQPNDQRLATLDAFSRGVRALRVVSSND